MCTNNADLILTNENTSLWLGNSRAALDFNFLKKNNISVIVNCTDEIPFIYNIMNIKSISPHLHIESTRIPIYDSPLYKDNHKLYISLKDVLRFIKTKFFKEHKNILIHCAAGMSRSASVMAAFLFKNMKDNQLNNKISDKTLNKLSDNEIMNNIIQYIIKKRSCAFYYGTKLNFKDALNSYFNLTLDELR